MNKDHERAKSLIEAAGGRFISVEFIKKDGSIRLMNIQPKAMAKHLVGDAASDSAKQAVETRKENHPELYPVWDVQKKAIRSINLDTLIAITVDKERHMFGA